MNQPLIKGLRYLTTNQSTTVELNNVSPECYEYAGFLRKIAAI